MQRDAAIVTGLFVAANACFIIFSNHWFNVWLQNNNEISEKQWFSNQVAVRGTEVSSVALKNVHLQHFIAVILHPKGKAMDSASISSRQEQGLMLRKGLDFPNSFHSGWGQLLTKANFNPP